MRDLFVDYNIPEELQDNGFIRSLHEQYVDADLTHKQIIVLSTILDRELYSGDLLSLEYRKVTVLKEHYNHCDYHGDYYIDSQICGTTERDVDMTEVLADYNANYHGINTTVPRYFEGAEITIPSIVEDADSFVRYCFDDFKVGLKRLVGNRFKSVKNKNRCIVLLRDLLDGRIMNPSDHDFLHGIYSGRRR